MGYFVDGRDMYKNQLQELAQRSCFNLPSYGCIREGPDHAPRFKASVNFNGEIFESPNYCTTLRQAEHAAAEVALNVLTTRGPSRSLTARVLDETGVYKNLLQETAHRAGLKLPVYTTVRSGPGHAPVFTCNVELAGMNFKGELAKTKKQAEKNAAIAAWSSLKRMPNLVSLSQTSKITSKGEELDQTNMAKVPSNSGPKDESRTIRRRNQNQAAGRRMQGSLTHIDTAGSSNSLQYQQKKLLDLLLDSAPLESLTPNKSSFVSLLPPLPPRTTSIILPQKSSKSLYPYPLDEHQRDEDEWLNGKSEPIKPPTETEGKGPNKSTSSLFHGENPPMYGRPFSLSNTGKLKSLVQPDHRTQSEQTHMGKRVLGATTQSQMGRSMIMHNNGGSEYYYPQRIAPAVQIRSVIPVYAAPAASMRPSNPPLLKEVATASTSAAAAGNSMSSVQNGAAGRGFNSRE